VHYLGFLPMEVRPDIGTTLAAHLADEQRFDIGQPSVPSRWRWRCRAARGSGHPSALIATPPIL
jgi:hypothetical protein